MFAIYILLIVLPDENLQKIFLYISHYVQGITIFLLLLNIWVFTNTVILWMSEVDLSNVFKNNMEQILNDLTKWEFAETIPNIIYLYLVYFFLADMRQFYML